MLVELAQHRIVLDERRHGAGRAATGKPVYDVLPKSPVSPIRWPVAITEAFTS